MEVSLDFFKQNWRYQNFLIDVDGDIIKLTASNNLKVNLSKFGVLNGKLISSNDISKDYEFKFDSSHCQTAEEYAVWVVHEIFRQNDCDIENINYSDYPAINAAIDYSPNLNEQELKYLINTIKSYPSLDWLKHTNDRLIMGGLREIFDECMHREVSGASSKYHNMMWAKKISSDITKPQKIRDAFMDAEIDHINKYDLTVIASDQQAWAQTIVKDDMEYFVIKTDGFNQCFRGDDGNNYSIVIRKSDRIYIVGCDDSSYSTYEELESKYWMLSRISPIMSQTHLHCLNFKFTN